MRLQFKLGQLTWGIAVIGIVLAAFIRIPDLVWFLLLLINVGCLVFSLCGFLYLFLRIPRRVRLAAELAIIVIELTLSANIWQPMRYDFQVRRAESLASRAGMWAHQADDAEVRAFFEEEARWASRCASTLHRMALWRGLIAGPSGNYQWVSGHDYELILEISIEDALLRHERRVQAAHEPRPH